MVVELRRRRCRVLNRNITMAVVVVIVIEEGREVGISVPCCVEEMLHRFWSQV